MKKKCMMGASGRLQWSLESINTLSCVYLLYLSMTTFRSKFLVSDFASLEAAWFLSEVKSWHAVAVVFTHALMGECWVDGDAAPHVCFTIQINQICAASVWSTVMWSFSVSASNCCNLTVMLYCMWEPCAFLSHLATHLT